MARPASDATVYAAIAHPVRRAALDLLRHGEETAGGLRLALNEQVASISQPAFSEHLSVLTRAGLVRSRPRGRERVYRLEAAALAEVMAWLRAYEAFWDQRLARLGDYLDRAPGEDER
jgi:DNA-binding transcriptional ArsR family regulator